jgi:hypothetical protein
MDATQLTNLLQIDISGEQGETKYLLARPESRVVVASCFDFETTSAIAGFPGI